ncbi:SIR2 family protein [Ensifer sp. IC3342]|nr:SIR2 family protein [Ensifer sp. BRP08]MCA1449801.1 SIR2 family protein [Ensifer sp. IC3342]
MNCTESTSLAAADEDKVGTEEKDEKLDLAAIETLPDYAALRQVKDALWKLGDVHGAAVMVGAGFSRFAKLAAATTPQPPLWSTFRDAMLQDLYPGGEGPSDPLILAEEYRSTLGYGALEGIIRKYIRDTEWEPGDLHGNLLRLPWSDVLTTNWDTLLERSAALDPDTSYDVVRVIADIARARRPRIVKLHGSMPSYLPFIFTEEDFRTYPERFAPFVNLAQQALLENELCLLGFSGEDPNFLKWAGWVRDKLGTAARPIRLIGVLNLAPSRRRLFEARNITPIDLSPLVQRLPQEDRHQRAMDILLEYFWQARPSANVEWECTSEKQYNLAAATDSDAKVALLASIWREDRERHPGWLVTPYDQRLRGRFAIQDTFKVLANELPKVSPATRAAMLYEAVWRWDALHWSLPPFFEEIAEKALNSEEDCMLPQDQRAFLHMSLVRQARHRRDWPKFETRLERLKSLPGEDAINAHIYEGCLRAREELDYHYLLENAPRLDGQDPVWGLRRAALLAEILETQSAARAVQAAHKEIRRRRSQDRRSPWLLSREAWASLMMRSAWFELETAASGSDLPHWPHAHKGADIDPWDELSSISDSLEEADRKQRARAVEKQPLFDPGRYRLNSGMHFVSSAVSHPYEQLAYLSERVGLPLRIGSSEITGRRWARAISTLEDDTRAVTWLALRSVISHDYELLEEHFSRLAVARLPREDVDRMVDCLRGAIAFGRRQMAQSEDRIGEWANRLKTMCELLSRLCVRLDGERAIECFQLASSLLSDPSIRHWVVLKGIGNLLTRSAQALQPERRHEIALDVLRLPLPNETKFGGIERDFPEASELLDAKSWKAREHTYSWNSRIAHLLDQSKGAEHESRRHAIFRLLRLFEGGALTDAEAEDFGRGLWSGNAPDRTAAETGLLPHVFLRLPSPDPNLPTALFAEVIQKIAVGSYDAGLLISLHSASYTLRHEYSLYHLKPMTAQAILGSLLQWQPKAADRNTPFDFGNDRDNEYTELTIARVLSSTILPSVPAEAVDDRTCDAILARIADGSMPSLLLALPAMIACNPSQAERAHNAIRAGLLAGRSRAVQAALNALLFLVERWESDGTPIPATLVSEVVTLCFMRREPGFVSALRVATRLVNSNAVPGSERSRLIEGIELIRTETSYGHFEDQSRRSDVGLIRRSAVQLCEALKNSGETAAVLNAWLSEVDSDPMPEVRYALQEEDE